MDEFSPEIAVLHSAFQLADKTCPGGLHLFSKQAPCVQTFHILQDALLEVGARGPRWPVKILALLSSSLLTSRSSVLVAGIRLPSVSWSLFFELVKQCSWTDHLPQVLDFLSAELAVRFLTQLLWFTCDSPANDADARLVAVVAVRVLSDDSAVVWRGAGEQVDSAVSADVDRLLIELLTFMRANAQSGTSSDSGLWFIALLHFYVCVVSGNRAAVNQSDGSRSQTDCHAFDATRELVEEMAVGLTELAANVDVLGSVDTSGSTETASVLREAYGWFARNDRQATTADDDLLARMLRKWLEPVVNRSDEDELAVGQIGGFPDKLAKAGFVIAERLEGYQEMCDWIVNISHIDILLDKRWLLCLQSHTGLFSSQSMFLALCERLAQLITHSDSAQQLRLVVLEIFRSLPVGLYDHILRVVRAQHDTEVLFAVDKGGDFHEKLVSTFNQLVNLTEEFPEMFRAVSVLALQSSTQVLQKLISDALTHSGQVAILATLTQELVSGDSSRLCETISHIISAQPLKPQEQLNLLSLLSILLLPHICILHVDYPITRKPALNAAEFLDTCVLQRIRFEASPSSERVEKSCCTSLAMLQVVMETLSGSHADWLTLSKCRPLAIAVCVCGVIDSCRVAAEMSAAVDWLSVKEAGVRALGTLLSALEEHTVHLDVQTLSWLYDLLRHFHWTTALYFSSSSLQVPLVFPSTLCTLLQHSDDKCWTVIEVHTQAAPVSLLLELCCTADCGLQLAKTHVCGESLVKQTSLYSTIVSVLVQMLPLRLPSEIARLFDYIHFLIQTAIMPVVTDQIELAGLPSNTTAPYTVGVCFSHVLRDVLQASVEQQMPAACLQRVCQQYVTALQGVCSRASPAGDSTQVGGDQTAELVAVFTDVCLCAHRLPADAADQLFVLALQLVTGLGPSEAPVTDQLCSAVHLLHSGSARATLLRSLQQQPAATVA